MLTKTLSTIETSVPVEEVDINANEELTQQFKIRGVPTLVMVNEDGVELKRKVGVMNPTELQEWINS
jgi:thioredoxin-related protein